MAYKQDSKDKSEKSLQARFKELDGKKGDIPTRLEDYAMWTLPYLFPPVGHKHTELQGPVDSTGAMAVNHLSNKMIMTMFPAYQPFFRLMVSNVIVADLKEAAKNGDEDAQTVLSGIDQKLADAEKDAMQRLDYNRYRTEAITACKLLIITGNALLYHPPNEKGKVQTYSMRDYCVERDVSGTVIELITRDKKALSTFTKDIQDTVKASNKGKYDKEGIECTLYSCVKLDEDGKYYLEQAIEEVELDNADTAWSADDLPWIALTWNLVRGEDYGRGLVEDYAGAFHALHVLSSALIDVAGIAADIKFLVDPSSVLDVQKLNDSESGTYHSGKAEDVTAIQIDKVNDLKIVLDAIDKYQRQIGAAFLLNSAVTRDAERVTAEEIKETAQELELSNGGIYSRFAEEWQLRTATLLLKKNNIKIAGKQIYPQIITGLDSLSRAGDMDNLRLMVQDLSMLDSVPEEIRAAISPTRFAQYVGIRRGVDYEKILKTPSEIQAEQQQQQQMMQQEASTQAAAKAGGAIATNAAGGQASAQSQ